MAELFSEKYFCFQFSSFREELWRPSPELLRPVPCAAVASPVALAGKVRQCDCWQWMANRGNGRQLTGPAWPGHQRSHCAASSGEAKIKIMSIGIFL